MKKALISMIFALALANVAFSQISLRFTGQMGNGTYIQLDSVVIENLTRSWTETLIYPDTVLVFSSSSIAEAQNDDLALESYPNPFRGTANVRLTASESGIYTLRLHNVSGQLLAESTYQLEAGTNIFEISLKKTQMALLTVSSAHGQRTLKLLNSDNAGDNSIALRGNSMTNNKIQSAHPFSIGDNMRYTGYVTMRDSVFASNPITQQQNGSELFSLIFNVQHLLPSVTTLTIRDITAYSIIGGSTIQSTGASTVTEWGLCWSTNSHPTTADSRFVASSATPLPGYSFSNTITGFTYATTYHIRAYATNYYGTSYGNELSFTTLAAQAPAVKTIFASSITDSSFATGGIVVSTGGMAVTARGLCWSNSRMYPTLNDSVWTATTSADTFPHTMQRLIPDTLYYVRAFATNAMGTTYGNVIAVHTTPDTVPGILSGTFSVSSTRIVRFSKGNLQWSAADSHSVAGGVYASGTWRFADNQYDYIGQANRNISAAYVGWIDLFGYGTSGYNNKYPYLSSVNYYDYVDSTISCTYYDWGTYNAISNGGDIPGYWRTLMGFEWDYLINTRPGARERFGMGSVDSINGTILLPDVWTKPEGLPNFIPGVSMWQNYYTTAQWAVMEQYGAVFLPNAGDRIGTNPVNAGSFGLYWAGGKQSTTLYDVLESSAGYFMMYTSNPDLGFSVRLVRDV